MSLFGPKKKDKITSRFFKNDVEREKIRAKLKKRLKNISIYGERHIIEISNENPTPPHLSAQLASKKQLHVLITKNSQTNEIKTFVYDPLDPHSKLGEGGQGCVFIAENLSTKEMVALKCHACGVLYEDIERERRNLAIVQQLEGSAVIAKTPGVDVSMLANDTMDLEYFSIMKLQKGKELLHVLYDIDKTKQATDPAFYIRLNLDIKTKLSLVLGILKAVHTETHQLYGLAHKDLKPSNILAVTYGMRTKMALIDWGSSVVCKTVNHGEKPETNKEFSASQGYTAPELFHKDRPAYSFAQDYWSLGVLIAEIISDENFQGNLQNWLSKAISLDPIAIPELRLDDLNTLMPSVFSDNLASIKFESEIDKEAYEILLSLVKQLVVPLDARNLLAAHVNDGHPLTATIDKLNKVFLKYITPQSKTYVDEISRTGLRAYRRRMSNVASSSSVSSSVQINHSPIAELVSEQKAEQLPSYNNSSSAAFTAPVLEEESTLIDTKIDKLQEDLTTIEISSEDYEKINYYLTQIAMQDDIGDEQDDDELTAEILEEDESKAEEKLSQILQTSEQSSEFELAIINDTKRNLSHYRTTSLEAYRRYRHSLTVAASLVESENDDALDNQTKLAPDV